MLILFVGEGRVGNQVFQYVALNSIASPSSRIIAVGLEHLEELFELRGPRCHVVGGGVWTKRIVKYLVCPLLLRPLARWLRIIGYAHERETRGSHAGSDGELRVRRGLFAQVLFVDGGFYQNSDYWPQPFEARCLELREHWRTAAREQMTRAGAPPERRPFFLHVRRGDYIGFTTYGLSGLQLPTRFYLDAIEAARARAPHRPLIVVTDDPPWAEREFASVPDRILVSSSPCVDFAIMAECAGGIISNSTFSLTAAMFMRAPEVVLGPRYWFGFRVNKWLPPRIRFEHERIEYLAIPGGAA